jgi:hypothetical protein
MDGSRLSVALTSRPSPRSFSDFGTRGARRDEGFVVTFVEPGSLGLKFTPAHGQVRNDF